MNGSTISVKKGEIIKVVLQKDKQDASDFNWEEPQKDHPLLETNAMVALSNVTNTNGTYNFQYVAKEQGTSKLVFLYRNNDDPGPPKRMFSVTIIATD